MAADGIAKNIGKVALSITAATVTALAPKAVEKFEDYIDAKTEEKKNSTLIPKLYSSGTCLTIEQAERLLEERGLKPQRSPVTKNTKYRNCSDGEVVDSTPKEKQQVPKGTFVELYYVTADVIDESMKEFVELERQKAEEAAEKARIVAVKVAEKANLKAEKAEEAAIKARVMADKLKLAAKEADDNAKRASQKVEDTRRKTL